MLKSNESPWGAGLEAAKRNRIPMLVLWTVLVALVIAYYMMPAVASGLEPVARWQRESGWIAAFLNRVVFCGVIPGMFLVCVKALRPAHLVAVIVVQTLWSGLCGIASDCMFSLNARLFGTGVDFLTLCVKTVVCQFVWTPLFFAPLGSIVYFWIGRDFSFRRFRKERPPQFWYGLVLPNLLVNWVIWIPAMVAINALPTPLQVQMSGLASSLFSLMLLVLGRVIR
ncbi:MAG: hypothetical protein IKO55_04360 [Kiritimatiellae bacterium]|nr:hypothetical protein [Kiritimatiellia bacterium]